VSKQLLAIKECIMVIQILGLKSQIQKDANYLELDTNVHKKKIKQVRGTGVVKTGKKYMHLQKLVNEQ
jgi:hypothetical protein